MDTTSQHPTRPIIGPAAVVRAVSAAAGRLVGRYRELLALPAARRLIGAAALSYVGDKLATVALVALAFGLGDGAVGVGGLLALLMLPRFVVQGWAGALVDRHPGPRLLVGTQMAMAGVAAAFALLTVVPNLWLLHGLTLTLASLRAVAMPAFEVQLLGVVPPEQRGAANAAHFLAMTTGELVGPLVGAAILVVAGPLPLFGLNALSFVGVAVAVLTVARLGSPQTATDSAAEVATEETEAAVSGGYRWLLRQPEVALYAVFVFAVSVGLLGLYALFASRAVDLGLGEAGIGLCYTVVGVGTLVGGLLAGIGRFTNGRALVVAAGAVPAAVAGMVVFGGSGSLVLAFAGLALAGAAGDIGEIAADTYFQNRLPAGVFGRFFSLMMMANGAGGLAGALLVPVLERWVGAGTALALVGLPAVGLALALAAVGLRPHRTASPVMAAA